MAASSNKISASRNVNHGALGALTGDTDIYFEKFDLFDVKLK